MLTCPKHGFRDHPNLILKGKLNLLLKGKIKHYYKEIYTQLYGTKQPL